MTTFTHNGTLLADKYASVYSTAGISSSKRKANGLALQAAIDYAARYNLRFEIPAGTYEIDLPGGLIIPPSYQGFEWQGSKRGSGNGATLIQQFADDTPILTCGAESDDSYTVLIDGVNLGYANDQSGFTGSSALKIKQTWRSQFRNITVIGGVNRPYICCLIDGGNWYFQNTMEHCKFPQGHKHALAIQKFGTGNVWRDLYLGGGAPDASEIDGSLLYMTTGGAAQEESIFEQINLEWAKCRYPMYLHTVRNVTFISTHFEGNILAGVSPALVYTENCQIQFVGLKTLENKILAADQDQSQGGSPAIIRDGFNSNISIDGLGLAWTQPVVDTPFHIFSRAGWYKTIRPSMLNIRQIEVLDSVSGKPALKNTNLTDEMNLTDYAGGSFEKVNSLLQHSYLPEVKQSRVLVTGDYTVYGHIQDGFFIVPTDSGAEVTLTLSNKQGAPGSKGANVPVRHGTLHTIVRGNGSADGFDIVVRNHDGTQLTSISGSENAIRVFFNGEDWAVA